MSRTLGLWLLLLAAAWAQPTPLSLEQALKEAEASSPTLRKQQARVDQAHFKIDEAYAPAYPRVDLTAGYYHLTPTLNFNTPQGALPILVDNNYQAAVVVEQLRPSPLCHSGGRIGREERS